MTKHITMSLNIECELTFCCYDEKHGKLLNYTLECTVFQCLLCSKFCFPDIVSSEHRLCIQFHDIPWLYYMMWRRGGGRVSDWGTISCRLSRRYWLSKAQG